jgi:hypothetical protein
MASPNKASHVVEDSEDFVQMSDDALLAGNHRASTDG